MTEVAVKSNAPAARLGYKSPVLRAASSAGVTLAGLAGIVGALGDVVAASSQHTAVKVLASSSGHFEYTSIAPAWNFDGVIGPALLGGSGAAIVAIGILQGMQALNRIGTLAKSALGMGGAIAAFGVLAGALTYGGSIGTDEDQQASARWMQAQFSTGHEIPQPNKIYNNSQSRYEYYPAVFSGTDSKGKELFYTVSPVLSSGSGDSIGLNVQQVSQAEAEKAQLAYTQSQSKGNN